MYQGRMMTQFKSPPFLARGNKLSSSSLIESRLSKHEHARVKNQGCCRRTIAGQVITANSGCSARSFNHDKSRSRSCDEISKWRFSPHPSYGLKTLPNPTCRHPDRGVRVDEYIHSDGRIHPFRWTYPHLPRHSRFKAWQTPSSTYLPAQASQYNNPCAAQTPPSIDALFPTATAPPLLRKLAFPIMQKRETRAPKFQSISPKVAGTKSINTYFI